MEAEKAFDPTITDNENIRRISKKQKAMMGIDLNDCIEDEHLMHEDPLIDIWGQTSFANKVKNSPISEDFYIGKMTNVTSMSLWNIV